MQLASSRIWTRVAVSFSNDSNHYTTGTSCSILPTETDYLETDHVLHVEIYGRTSLMSSPLHP